MRGCSISSRLAVGAIPQFCTKAIDVKMQKMPSTRSFDVFFICAWTNGLANNRYAGDLGCGGTHYDVTVNMYVHIYSDIIMSATASQITGVSIVC